MKSLQKRVTGGVIPSTGRDDRKFLEEPPPDPPFVDNSKAFTNLSRFSNNQNIKIMPPTKVKKTTPVFPVGPTPGPGAYVKVQDSSQVQEKKVSKHKMRKER